MHVFNVVIKDLNTHSRKHISVFHSMSLLYRLHCIWIDLFCHSPFNLEIVESDVSGNSSSEGEGGSESELEGAGK